MKNYLLFAGSHYYPSGGWEDYRGEFDTVDAAKEFASQPNDDYLSTYPDWYQIVDINTRECVYARNRKHGTGQESEWYDPTEAL